MKFLSLILLFMYNVALAQTLQPVYGPMTLLGVNAGNQKLYTPIGYNGTISQYSNPQVLTKLNAKNQGATSTTSVSLLPNGTLQLAEDGALLPCLKNYVEGQPELVQEDDLYYSPAKVLINNLVISQLSNLYVSGTITAKWHLLKKPPSCLSQATSTAHTFDAANIVQTVILNNAVKNQVFFYQVQFSLASAVNKKPVFFEFGINNQQATQTQSQFGFNDYASITYGVEPLQQGIATSYNFNVLPALKTDIAAGAIYGMDQNLADWKVGIVNGNSAIWGKYYIGWQLENWSVETAFLN